MAKYIQWLMDNSNKVLHVERKQQLFEQHFTMSDEFEGMGYTWSRQERNGVYYYQKKGETVNFFSRIVIYPEQNTGVFIAFNTYVDSDKLDAMMLGITDLVLGKETQNSRYSEGQTADISGHYITTRSNFTKQEKVINFLTPNKIFHISGNLFDGFKLNDERLLPSGENYYSTSIGDLKFIEENERSYLASNSATSYIRIPWYESSNIQMIIFGFFMITSFIMAMRGILSLLRRKGRNMNKFLSGISIINLVLLISMSALIFMGIKNFNMLSMTPFVTLVGILIAITSVVGILNTIYLYAKRFMYGKDMILFTWNIASLLFCLWMWQVNII